ncbi:MAG: tryptophan--tRNA ligase [Acetobacteraceae bacterium]
MGDTGAPRTTREISLSLSERGRREGERGRGASASLVKDRIFSGIQPSGVPTLGNYLGAIRHWVPLQKDHSCIYCVVDLHAITMWQDPRQLPNQTRELAASLIACGIDPETSILFHQSAVAEHAELAWIFNCVARLGWLNRMTQFKDKVGKDRENASAGVYVYPNLMAADILAYHATGVPVGDDQRQHVELANDIAQKFNHDYGVAFFPAVEPLIFGPATRVMSLRDGSKKMSKSDASDQSRINLNDSADAIVQKIRRAKTDAAPLPSEPEGLAGRPEARNLVGIYAALAKTDEAGVLKLIGGKGFAAFKDELADLLVATVGPIAAETNRLLDDPAHVEEILRAGAVRARAIAAPIVGEAKRLVGLLPA